MFPCFQMLQEVGFIAGQHEVLAESFSKENYKHVHEQAKKLKEIRKRNMKEYDKHLHQYNASRKEMEVAKDKLRKAYEDQEKAKAVYKAAADSDASSTSAAAVTAGDLKKLSMQASAKTAACDSMKGHYAQQMYRTNDARHRHYFQLLPGVLGELEAMEKNRIALFNNCLLEMVSKEREVAPIVAKCQQAIVEAVRAVDPAKEAALTVDKLKSGDVPPGDFRFEDITDLKELLAQDTLAENQPTNLNLYPRKRELGKRIEAAEKELLKSLREKESLDKMLAAYQNQPKYGKSDRFKAEVQVASAKVDELRRLLQEMKLEKAAVEAKLEELRERVAVSAESPLVAARSIGNLHQVVVAAQAGAGSGDTNMSPMLNSMQRNIVERSSNLSLSLSSSSGASSSSGSHLGPSGSGHPLPAPMGSQLARDGLGVYANHHQPHPDDEVDYEFDGGDYEDFPPPPPPSQVVASPGSRLQGHHQHRQHQLHHSYSSASSDASSSSSGVHLPPSPQYKLCEAMYDFTECDENNISMAVGDRFCIVEDECDGWTRVRRLMASPEQQQQHPGVVADEEGYVPSSYLRPI